VPAISTGRESTNAIKPRPRRVAASPDQQDRSRAARRQPTPDQSDRSRSAPQKARDRVAVATNVRQSRLKYIERTGRGAGVRDIQKAARKFARFQSSDVKVVSPQEATRLRAKGVKVHTLTPAESKDVGATVGVRTAGGGASRAAVATGIGLAKDPKTAIPATGRGFRDALTGIPSSLLSLITDPVGTAEGVGKDYSRRYGGINKPGGVAKMAERVSKEGAAPEILDATILTSGVGGAVGRGLTRPAAAGKLGERAQRVAVDARPEKRVSGDKTVEQEKSPNLIVAAGQAARDKRRVGKNQRQITAARDRGRPVDAVRREAALRGEVPARPREATRLLARDKGRDLERQKREQRVEVDQGSRRDRAGLSKQEKLGFRLAQQLGIPADAAVARAALAKRRAAVVAAREDEGVSVPKVRRKTSDELDIIDRLIEHADEIFTPHLREVVKESQKRERRVAASDPGLDPVQSQLRRYAAQAQHLGIKRRKAEDAELQATRRAIKRLDPDDPRRVDAEAELEASRLELEDIREASRGTPAKRTPNDGKMIQAEERFWDAHEQYEATLRKVADLEHREGTAEGASPQGQVFRDRANLLRAELAGLRKVRTEALRDIQRLRGPDTPNHGPESAAEYLRRVKRAAAAEGLARPGYFASQKRPRAGNADRAPGGSRAIAGVQRYKGDLFRTGREVNDPEVFDQGLARGIKRKYNWNRVARTFDEHSFEWGRNKTVEQIREILDEKGIDHDSVALWNPGRYYSARRRAEMNDDQGDATGRGEEPVVAGLDKAVDASAVTFKDLADRPEDFSTTRRQVVDEEGEVRGYRDAWTVVPKAVYDEIHADTRPSGVVARSWDIAKGKQSRILLGLSPAWLQFQVASNAILSGLAGTGPVDLVKANAWWKTLSDSEQAAIEPFIGTGHFSDSTNQTKLGAARTRSEKVNQMIDGYRAMKTTPFMQKVGRGNPLDLLFRIDAAQNRAFRRGVLYSQVKRDAYSRMGQNTKLMAGAQTRFMHAMDLGPAETMKAIISDPRALERHAQHVNDFLGDYQTFTASERRGLQRAVMFYGFLRFSLRFTFMTMPIKHPLMSAIVAQLGRLQVDEVRKLLGGDELPWALGKLYFTKQGRLKSVDLARANPAMNAITNFRGPKDALGFVPPIVGALVDQMYAKSGFKQREWRVEGENQPRHGEQGYGVENRVRIFLNQMFSLAAPYRAALSATQPGPKGDDSLLGSARPTGYKDPRTLYSIAASQQKLPDSVGGRLLQQFAPFIPRDDDAPELAASIRARNGEKTGAAPRSVGPPPGGPAKPTREQLELMIRQRLNRRPSSGGSAAELEVRRRLSQR
jgi:hypothetical protein